MISAPWIEPLPAPRCFVTPGSPSAVIPAQRECAAVEELTGAVDHGMAVADCGVHDAADEQVWVLACSRSRISTSICAPLRLISGLPNGPGSQSRPANLSGGLRREHADHVELVGGQMLIARCSARNRHSCVDDVRCTATMTVGGSRETLENAFTARPRGFPSSIAVTTVTPVTNCLFTCFIVSRSGPAGAVMGAPCHGGQSVLSDGDDAERGQQGAGIPGDELLHDAVTLEA